MAKSEGFADELILVLKSYSRHIPSTPAERHAARACPAFSGMTWAQRLKRVLKINIEVGGLCVLPFSTER